jgi:predicted MPP superfamily phosphohydrolase
MSESAKKLKTPIPTIVFMGNGDYITKMGSRYFYDRMPKHDKSKYNRSSASHRDVPQTSFKDSLEWIKNLIK